MDNYLPRKTWKLDDILDLTKIFEEYPTYNTLHFFLKKYSLEVEHHIEYSLLQELPYEISYFWKSIGIELDNNLDLELSKKKLEDIFNYIEYFDKKSIYKSVKLLVKSVHLIKTDNIFNDVSFSDPEFPFTIFMNIPDCSCDNWLERSVENIIHETMHLQLSLLENKYSLYSEDSQKMYSPWKGEKRNSRGILHALYVFSNLKSFWLDVYKKSDCKFAASRINEIRSQIDTIDHYSLNSFYTANGLKLANSCLEKQF